MAEKTKRSGMLGGLSFKRSAKPKKAATSNGTPTPEPQITGPPLPASAMAGKLVNCPLQSAEYAEAWALATKLGRRPKVSRLHGSLDGLLTDSAATQHFVNHQKANHNIAMYNFWKLVKKYADDFVKRSVEDRNVMAVDIFDRFVAKSVFDLPAAIKTQLTKVVDKKSDFKVNVFDQAQQHVYTELKTKQFNDFQKSPQYSQHCITVITSGTVYLEDMLYNESFLMGFMEYMTMENSSSIIQFWLIADDFQTQLLQVDKKGKPTLDAAHAKSDAMGIFKRFFCHRCGRTTGC